MVVEVIIAEFLHNFVALFLHEEFLETGEDDYPISNSRHTQLNIES
jgi:hypothetical protein